MTDDALREREDHVSMTQQPFLQKLTLRNFRSIRHETVTFANPLFLVGRNGSGKSNFVDALAFLSECIDRPLLSVIMGRGNMVGLCRQIGNGEYASDMAVRIDFELGVDEKQQGYYVFQISATPTSSFRVSHEQCFVNGGGKTAWFNRQGDAFVTNINGFAPVIEAQSLALPLVGGMKDFSPVAQFLRAMSIYAVEPSRMRGLHYPDAGTWLKRDGSNIASMLQRIGQHPEGLSRVVELLNAVVPSVIDVKSLSRGDDITLAFLQLSPGNRYMGFADIGMSDGTLRTMGLIVAALQDPAPSLIAIEEPELNIHPGALEAIADILNIAAQRTQVVVTTHSPDLLDTKWIQPENLRVVEWEAGATRISGLGEAPVQALRQHLMGAGELMRADALDAAQPFTADAGDVSDLFDESLA